MKYRDPKEIWNGRVVVVTFTRTSSNKCSWGLVKKNGFIAFVLQIFYENWMEKKWERSKRQQQQKSLKFLLLLFFRVGTLGDGKEVAF